MADNAQNIYAYQDAIDLLVDYLDGNAAEVMSRNTRRAIVEAYDELCAAKNWSHFTRLYPVQAYEPETGTFSYVAATKTYTIDTGSWPVWAAGATLVYGENRYRIQSRPSSTTLIGTELSPFEDIATGAEFTIVKDIFTLPETFMSLVKPRSNANDDFNAKYVTPHEWADFQRLDNSTGSPLIWTIMADPVYVGRQAMFVWPSPDADGEIVFTGRFFPRTLKFTGYRANERVGTVSLSGNTITGTGTAFTEDMVGSLIRVSSDGTTHPDGKDGNNPYVYQRIITGYSSATSLTFGGDAVSASGKKYVITDPIDVDRTMINALWRACEAKVAHKKSSAAEAVATAAYREALAGAKASDSRIPNGVMSAWDVRATGTQWVQGEDDLD